VSAAPALTLRRRLDAGPIVRAGSVAPYRSIAELAGEPYTVRSELIGVTGTELTRGGRALACVAQLTDLHMTDVESPARFEFVNREYADPRFRELLPMQRPQEALNAHALEAMVRTINGIEGGPVTGAPLELVAMTGDAVDNAQENELNLFIDLFDGGYVNPKSGGPEYEGVQSPSWPGDIYWKPDGVAHGEDLFASAYGFPRLPGLIQRALQPIQAGGLKLPWIGCHGNHEELCQGVGIVTKKLEAALAGTRKPFRLPDSFDRDAAVETFVNRPEALMAGPSIDVTADRSRRPFRPDSFVDAHFRLGARPRGHGFTEQNQEDGTAYYVFDTPAVRFITLDTACPAGGADGCLDADQIRWLERRLEEVHSKFQSRHGLSVSASHHDRLVVILSHHGLDTLSNPRAQPGAEGSAYVAADDLPALLHRFGNVVLWLNGHIHANRVRPRPDPSGVTGGFWEVTTASLVDWPCQGRLVEVVDAGDGMLAIACTMVDHDGAIAAGGEDPVDLAGLHRELAGNAPFAGFVSGRAGSPHDRNVILPLRAPFPLRRLHSE
jgi:metallophosphoesterase (TIGR03767 family)